jgi:hypothetical protein
LHLDLAAEKSKQIPTPRGADIIADPEAAGRTRHTTMAEVRNRTAGGARGKATELARAKRATTAAPGKDGSIAAPSTAMTRIMTFGAPVERAAGDLGAMWLATGSGPYPAFRLLAGQQYCTVERVRTASIHSPWQSESRIPNKFSTRPRKSGQLALAPLTPNDGSTKTRCTLSPTVPLRGKRFSAAG